MGPNMPSPGRALFSPWRARCAAAGIAVFGLSLSACPPLVHVARAQTDKPAEAQTTLPPLADAAAYIARAAESAAAGRHADAVADYAAALAVDARNLVALKGRGDANLALGQYDAAVADYGAAIAADRDAASRYHDRGRAYHQAGRYEEAIDDFNEMLLIDDSSGAGYGARAMAYEALARFQEFPERLQNQALRDYTRAIRLEPENAELLARRAGLYNTLLNYEQAIADADAAIELEAELAMAHAARGDAHFALQNYDAAIADFTLAIQNDDQSPVHLESRGWAYRNSGRWDEAFADYAAAVALDPHNYLRHVIRANAYYDHAYYGYDAKSYAASIPHYTAAIELRPDFATYYEYRANAHRNDASYRAGIGDLEAANLAWENAFLDYDKAIDLERIAIRYNTRGDAYYYYAQFHERQGQYVQSKDERERHAKERLAAYENSIADFEAAILLDAENPLYFENKAISLRNLNRRDEAIVFYTRAIRLDEGNPSRWINRGHALYWWGENERDAQNYEAARQYFENAIADYAAAIALAPDNSTYYEFRANACRYAGRMDEALADFQRAIDRNPQNAEHFLARARCYRDFADQATNAGNTEEALERYRQAIADCDRAIALDAASDQPYNLRAICNEGLGDDAQAIADYAKALERKTDDAVIYGNRATVYIRLKDYQAAIDDATAAINLNPDAARDYNTRGDGHYWLRQYEEAIADYASAIERAPEATLYWENLGFAYRIHAAMLARRGVPLAGTVEYWDGAFAAFRQSTALREQQLALLVEAGAGDSAEAEVVRGRLATTYSYLGDLFIERDNDELKDAEQAAEAFTKAIELQPENGAFRQSRGVAYRYSGQWDNAYADFAEAERLRPGRPEPLVARGHAYHDQQHYEEAVAEYGKAIELDPQNSEYRQFRANSYRLGGKWEEAIADFASAIELDPENPIRYNSRGDAYYYRGDYEEAEADYAKAVSLDPQNPLYWENRGLALRLMRDAEEAFKSLDEAVRLDPENPARYSMRADCYRLESQYDKAVEDYSAAINFNPRGLYYVRRGLSLRLAGKPRDQWLPDYLEALKLEPNVPEHYNSIGDAYYAVGENQRAIDAFTKAMDLGLKSAAYYNYRGNAYHALKQYDRAIEDYSEAIALDPDEAQYQVNRANSRRLAGDYEASFPEYDEAIALAPNNPEHYNARGDAYFFNGDYPRSVEDFTKAIDLAPDVALYWFNRAVSYRDMGEWAKSDADFARAMELAPQDAANYLERGISRRKRGLYAEAIADFTTALEIRPDTAGYLQHRAVAYQNAKQWPEAFADFNRAIELDPKSGDRYNARGDGYYAQAEDTGDSHDFALAIDDYTRAIDVGPAKALYHNNRGYMLWRLQRYAAALLDYDQAIEMEPGGASHFNARANVYYRMGEQASADADYTKAIELLPDTAVYYENRARSRDEAGRWEEALADFAQAIELEPQNAERYNARGDAYNGQGEADAAIADYEQAIAIDPDSSLYRGNLSRARRNQVWSAAQGYRSSGQYEQAIAAAVDMLAIEREWLGADHTEIPISIEWIASACQEAALALVPRAPSGGNGAIADGEIASYLTRAEERYAEAVAWREKNNGADDWRTVDARIALADVQLLRKMTLAQIRKYIEWDEVHSRSVQRYEAARYGESLREAEAARDLCLETVGKTHPRYATALVSMARAYRALNDNRQAEDCYDEALALRRQAFGGNHPTYAASLDLLAELYLDTGRSRDAVRYFVQSVAIRSDTSAGSLDHAMSLRRLAGAHMTIDNYFEAEDAYTEAQTYVDDESLEYATVLRDTSCLYSRMDEHADEVQASYDEALEKFEQAVGRNHPEYAYTLYSLAGYYERTDRFGPAALQLQQALTIMFGHVEQYSYQQTEHEQLNYGRKLQIYLDAYLRCLLKSGEGDESAYRQVLAWKGATLVRQRAQKLFEDSPELAALRNELRTIVPQWAALQTMLSQASSDGEVKKWQGRLDELGKRKQELELELNEKINAAKVAAAEAGAAEQSADATLESLLASLPSGGALVDYLEYTDYQPSEIDPGRYVSERRLAAFVVRTGSEAGPVKMFDLGPVRPISEAIDRWRINYGLAGPSLEAGQLLKQTIWAPLEPLLTDATMVVYSPDGALGRLSFTALPGAKPDSYLIEDFPLVLVPVPQLIPELMKGGVAAELPKELLVMGGVNYDSRDAAAESATVEAPDAPLRPWERRNADALAMRSVAGDEPLKFLAGSDSEASFIRQLYENAMQLPIGSDRVVQLRGAAATEEEFRRLAPQCYIMHLATHGFFASEDALGPDGSEESRAAGFDDGGSAYGYSLGLLSGLALAGANNPPEIPDDPALLDRMPDDGFLTADEIAVLPLGAAQLVVLSACDSGLGATAGGEGLLGVQRAFQVAGARTTIASLWMVNDEATRRIMEEFYRNYLDREQGMSALEALRAAQIWALNNPDLIPRGADAPPDEGRLERLPPQFWAAFTLSGAWN